MKLKAYKAGDQEAVTEACDLLRKARNLLKIASATKAVDKVRSALKSAEGAERHAWRRKGAGVSCPDCKLNMIRLFRVLLANQPPCAQGNK